jgi:acylphosphatase
LALKAFLVRVFGRVQRVGYRRFVLDSAQELGLSGYVRNEKDGTVTVFVQGDDAVVEKFIEMLKSSPQPAYVRSVDIKEVKPKPRLKYFAIKPSPLHEELQEGFGAMQSIFMDYGGEFRGFVGEFRDFRDESLKISREILDEVKGLRKDLQTILDERFARMERDIAKIKAKIGLT